MVKIGEGNTEIYGFFRCCSSEFVLCNPIGEINLLSEEQLLFCKAFLKRMRGFLTEDSSVFNVWAFESVNDSLKGLILIPKWGVFWSHFVLKRLCFEVFQCWFSLPCISLASISFCLSFFSFFCSPYYFPLAFLHCFMFLDLERIMAACFFWVWGETQHGG